MSTAAADPRRAIPGVGSLLDRPWCRELADCHRREWVAGRLRALLDDMRAGRIPVPDSDEGFAELVKSDVDRARRRPLRGLINATGVILHTNLGRAPLGKTVADAMGAVYKYCNLEMDLESGERSSRSDHCAELVREVTGAEDGLVVNNNAAAVALSLAAFAAGKGVAVSHGELVEIGGGFRIPEMIEAAGAKMAAVGTTNRTRLRDYERAVAAGGVAAILKVHRSNFSMSGFTEEAGLEELAALGRRSGIPVIHDLGSGLLMDAALLGLPPEPTPADSIAAGASLVAFSGDKLAGGPQAGIIAGTAEAVARTRSHPLYRALRCDKVTLAGLAAALALYRLDPECAIEKIPALRLIAMPLHFLESRARSVVDHVRRLAPPRGQERLGARTVSLESLVGGGTLPDARIPSAGIVLDAGDDAARWLAWLRGYDPAIVARGRRGGEVVFDLRSVSWGTDPYIHQALIDLAKTL